MLRDNCVGIECLGNADFSDIVAFDDIFQDNLKEGVASSHKGISYAGDDYTSGGGFASEEPSKWYKTNILVNNYYASIGISLLLVLLIYFAVYCFRKERTGKERHETIIADAEDTGIQLGDADADAPFPQIT